MKREAIVLAKKIRSLDIWDLKLLREFCTLAGFGEAFECADSETFESVVYKAADVLGVSID